MQTQVKRVTPEEYLELERKADVRSEYRDGEIIQMTGGSANHNTIFINWCALLKVQLRGKNAKVFGGDLRLWIPDFQLYTYPDVMVIQGAPIFHDDRKDIVTNPSLIVEVLSKSTQEYDRSEKFKMYRSIPQFQEYILINQYQIEIEHYAKTAEGWLFKDYEANAESISLRSLELKIAIADLYEGVTFEQG
ncbi:Uma2 family endonuclease [Pseudanabaenaceae cyanobacterium LEGE 13415]|nr:Uma2 family endonuclease [Pseudanabaenaceae cyanobacterium LEGE 13415]